jgi:hypothetical protein
MAELPLKRFFVLGGVGICLSLQAWLAGTALAAEGPTNAAPPLPFVVAKAQTPPGPLRPAVGAEIGASPKPQPTTLIELNPSALKAPRVERVTVLAQPQPQLQDAPLLVLRPYVETH